MTPLASDLSGSKGWPFASARMPDGEDDQLLALHAVVQVVTNAAEMKSAHAGEAGVSNSHSYARLAKEQVEGRAQVVTDCPGRSGAIGAPPDLGTLDLGCGTARDA